MSATACIVTSTDGKLRTRFPSITKAIDAADRLAYFDKSKTYRVERERDQSLVYEIMYHKGPR